jgi:hypothetical protein
VTERRVPLRGSRTTFVFGIALIPRATRLVASTFTAVAVSDFLQLAYAAAERRAKG